MKDVTIVAIDFLTHDLTRRSIENTLKHIDPKEILVISDKEIYPGARHVIRPPVDGMPEYNQLMLKGVAEHVETGHALYVQWDGMACDGNMWTDDFLNYDYIGAIWPWEPKEHNVGNGGFSLRSKQLLDACLDTYIQLDESRNFTAEDAYIGINYRNFLEEKYSIKFAPEEVARSFSFELGTYQPCFGFHGPWNIFHLMPSEEHDYYYQRMDYAKWNHYRWHHVLAALIRVDRMDIYKFMVNKLIENSPELLPTVAAWLEHDSQNPRTELIID